jgi:hypothetical protein
MGLQAPMAWSFDVVLADGMRLLFAWRLGMGRWLVGLVLLPGIFCIISGHALVARLREHGQHSSASIGPILPTFPTDTSYISSKCSQGSWSVPIISVAYQYDVDRACSGKQKKDLRIGSMQI